MKFSIKNFFSKFDQILKKLWIWSHLLKKSLMENFIFVQWFSLLLLQLLEFFNRKLKIRSEEEKAVW